MRSFHKIATPENVDLQLELAGIGNRLQAKLIDMVYKWLPLVFVFVVLALIQVMTHGSLGSMGSNIAVAILSLITFAYTLAWGILFEILWNGQTPGKRVAGIRVVDAEGYPLTLRAVAIRQLLAFADMLPTFYLLGGILVMASSKAQRLGDMAAGTLVIRERPQVGPRLLFEEERFLDIQDPVARLSREHLANLRPDDRNLLKDFFLRGRQFERTVYARLVTQLAQSYWERAGIAEPFPTQLPQQQLFLKELYLALRDVATSV